MVIGRGTLYPDVIESTSFKGPSTVIKSHHNVGGLPARMKMELLEPLRLLFKDLVCGCELEKFLCRDVDDGSGVLGICQSLTFTGCEDEVRALGRELGLAEES
eukprot:5058015-Amphidinium_carterae.1